MRSPVRRQMRLGAFFNPTGHHVASWRHADAQADAGVNFEHYVEIARTAERGKFDMLFLADNLCVREARMSALSRSAQYIANFEPLTLLSALSVVTQRIGLVATASSSYNEPYHVARKFASLDHISHGRAGWNLVTSGMPTEAGNFGRDAHYGHAERYKRALEFATVVTGLWDSWDDDAFLRDKASGEFFRPGALHALNHKGAHFSVKGPLNIPRAPQGRPVIVQAGGSEDMMEVASQFAEVIFCGPLSVQAGKTLYDALKGRAAARGRDPESMKIMPGLTPIVGRTKAEAQDKLNDLDALIHPDVAIEMLATVLGGVDLSSYDPDALLPDDLPTKTEASQFLYRSVIDLGRREKLTLRQLAIKMSGARGKSVVAGSPTEIADMMEEWFEAGAADGFNISPSHLPGGLDEFVNEVIPVLQERGLFRSEYGGTTLRDHLGLSRPASRYESS